MTDEKPKRIRFDAPALMHDPQPPIRAAMRDATYMGDPVNQWADLVKQLQCLRHAGGLSQTTLAHMLGDEHGGIVRKWEGWTPEGRRRLDRPTVLRLMEWCRAMNVVLVPVQVGTPSPLEYGVEPPDYHGGQKPSLATIGLHWRNRYGYRLPGNEPPPYEKYPTAADGKWKLKRRPTAKLRKPGWPRSAQPPEVRGGKKPKAQAPADDTGNARPLRTVKRGDDRS